MFPLNTVAWPPLDARPSSHNLIYQVFLSGWLDGQGQATTTKLARNIRVIKFRCHGDCLLKWQQPCHISILYDDARKALTPALCAGGMI